MGGLGPINPSSDDYRAWRRGRVDQPTRDSADQLQKVAAERADEDRASQPDAPAGSFWHRHDRWRDQYAWRTLRS
jgi:hypothetical protein